MLRCAIPVLLLIGCGTATKGATVGDGGTHTVADAGAHDAGTIDLDAGGFASDAGDLGTTAAFDSGIGSDAGRGADAGGISLGCGANPGLPAGDSNLQLQWGGKARTYHVHVPASYTATQATTLVFNFHGFGSDAFQEMPSCAVDPLPVCC